MSARTPTMRRRAASVGAAACLAAVAVAAGCDREADAPLISPTAPSLPAGSTSGGCPWTFGASPPSVFFVPEAFTLTSPDTCGCPPPAITGSGDTVCAYSTVTFVWSGADSTSEIVCWESWLDGGPWIAHEAEDTTRTAPDLAPGRHTFVVRAVNDSGWVSVHLARFILQANFDPVTSVDRSSLITLGPPASGLPPQPLVTHAAGMRDTIPYGSRLSFRWSSSDCDSRVVSYHWRFAFDQGQTAGRTATTSPVLFSTYDGSPGFPLLVKGVDEYGAVENRPDTVLIHVNLRPWVRLLDTMPLQVPVGPPHDFRFEGGDRDSDPDLLTYSWQFDTDAGASQPTTFPPDSMWVQRAFTPSEVGARRLILRAFDQSGWQRPSDPDTLWFDVVP